MRRGRTIGTARGCVVLGGVLAVLLAVGGCSGVPGVYTVERADDLASATGPQAGGPFDATAYVAGIWDEQVVPTITGSADDAATLLQAIATDQAAAGATYGRQTGTGSPFTFTVQATGTVLAVDTSAPQGTLAVDLAPGDGTADLFVAVGPAFLGTALRDALPFIDFSQFTNQLDYAGVATALNATVKERVVGDLDLAAVTGATVVVVGAFALLDPKNVVVTPVSLEVTA